MKICVYTITKNEEKLIKRWVDSVKNADLIFIADTGSTDNTINIAKEFGVQVQSIRVNPFRFDTARNAALALIPEDIDLCISLDIDEILTENWRDFVEDLWNKKKFTKLLCNYVRPNKEIKTFEKIHSRFGYTWKYAIHEYLVPDSRIIETVTKTSKELVEHLPDLSKSRDLYHQLLKLTVTEEKDSSWYAFNLFEYAKSCTQRKEYGAAVRTLTTCIEVCKSQNSANLPMVEAEKLKIEEIIKNFSNTKKPISSDDVVIIEPHKKNIVIGAALNLKIDPIKAFIKSFLRHNTTDDLKLLVDESTAGLLQDVVTNQVELIIFNPLDFSNETQIHNSRFLGYLNILENNRFNYKNVFLTDTRDVIFQKNIFVSQELADKYLYMFTEDSGISINQDKHNTKWLVEAYDTNLLTLIGNNNIICSGTLLGDIESTINFLHLMKKEFDKIEQTKPDVFKKNYFDQTIFNYIGYTMTIPNLKILANGKIIGTICLSSLSKNAKDKITIEDNKVLVNNDIPSVIHQYDRNKKVSNFLINEYLK